MKLVIKSVHTLCIEFNDFIKLILKNMIIIPKECAYYRNREKKQVFLLQILQH